MPLFFGLLSLLLFGAGVFLVLGLLRFLALAGIAILMSIGFVSLAIAAITFFGLYQLFGAEYGALNIAVAIAIGLLSAFLILRRIASEIHTVTGRKLKETSDGR